MKYSHSTRRVVAILLSIIMIVLSFPNIVFAESKNETLKYSEVTVNVDPGDDFSIRIKLSNNTGITDAMVRVNYNTETLILESVNYGGNFSKEAMPPETLEQSIITLLWSSEKDVVSGDVIYATLNFAAKDKCAENSKETIRVAYFPYDFIYKNPDSDGLTVSVMECIPGDINHDGKVSMLDLRQLREYLNTYNIEVLNYLLTQEVESPEELAMEHLNTLTDTVALDVNHDGAFTMLDVNTLARYIAHYNGYIYYGNRFSRMCSHKNLETILAKKPTNCAEAGNIEYWYCRDCNKYYSDWLCMDEISLEDTVVTGGAHSLEAIPAVAATCTEAGNSEYWHCTKCGKYFADADGNKEITIESTIVEAKGHSYSTVWSFDTEYHWHDASCGCDDAGTIDKAKHIVDKDGHCACGYSAENNYTVQYYWENIDDSGYTLHETVSGYAPVGSVVNAEIKKYEHFNAVDSSVSATIDSIDITVLKVYYRRDVYTITFDPNGGRLFGTAVQKVKYGGNAVLPEFERDPDDNFFYEIDRYDGIYKNVQGDATVTVIWKSRRMNELSAPSNVAIDNDTVSWSAVENAASYIVTAGDYSFETKSTSCALSRLKNAAGETIVDYGTIDVTVTAVGKSGYKNATSSAIQNFYVPETKGADYDELYKWNIGHGYNLIENEYLKLNEFRSNLAVFNLGKLMTIGTADINSKNNQTTYDAYSFSSVDDYMSQLNIDFNTSASVGANASFWKFKAAATLKTALGLSMSTTLKE